MIVTRITRLQRSLNLRFSEWMLAFIMLGLGLMYALPEHSMDAPAMMQMTYTMPETAWGVVSIIIGGVRILVLGINGAWKKQGHARAVLGILCLLVWTQTAIVFLNYPPASPGDIIFPIFVISELFLIFRAAKEAGTIDVVPDNGAD